MGTESDHDQSASPAIETAPAASARTVPGMYTGIIGLQRSAGNAAVVRMLQASAGSRPVPRPAGPPWLLRQETPAPTDTAPPQSEQQGTGPGKGPVKTGASGVDALKALAVLKTATPVRVPGGAMGEVELVPGTNINGKILLYAAPLQVFYIDGDDVWEAYTPDFVRDIWLTAFAQGVERAKWLVPLIKAEFALIQGFLAPWYVMLGLFVLESVVFYDENKSQIKQSAVALKALNDLRSELKNRYPTLHDKLLEEALVDALFAMKEGVGLDDVAYFIGRVLGTQGLLGKHMAGVAITLKVIGTIIGEYAVLIAILHGPKMVGAGLEAAAKSSGAKLRTQLADAGIAVSDEDATKIVKELAADPESKQFLEDMGVKAKDASRLLEDVMKLGDKPKKQGP